MRTAFIETLSELAGRDPRLWLVCGDLGYSVLESFAEHFPERYVNAGVAEQNMTGIAAGLALCGKIVFTYSIANFPVMRCLEQVRNDVCYHNLNVKIVAVGGGMAYGPAGYTHHAVEDLGIMRALPNMTVVAPGDPVETRLATRALVERPGPCYLRLGKAGEPTLHSSTPDLVIGKALELRPGNDLVLISTGGTLGLTLQVAQTLAEQGFSAQVASMHTVQPIDQEFIRSAAHRTGRVITVEEHGRGGLGSATAEVIAQLNSGVQFVPVCLNSTLSNLAGQQNDLRAAQGVSVDAVVEAALKLLGP